MAYKIWPVWLGEILKTTQTRSFINGIKPLNMRLIANSSSVDDDMDSESGLTQVNVSSLSLRTLLKYNLVAWSVGPNDPLWWKMSDFYTWKLDLW